MLIDLNRTVAYSKGYTETCPLLTGSHIRVLMKCMAVLEENSALLKERRPAETSEALLRMVACITYYLSRTLGVLERPEASLVMERGQKLLQGVYQAQVVLSRPADPRLAKVSPAEGEDMSLQMRALSRLNKTGGNPQKTCSSKGNEGVTHTQDPIALHHLIVMGDLNSAYHEVMTLRRRPCFVEVAALLLQRAMAEDTPGLVVQWGTEIFTYIRSQCVLCDVLLCLWSDQRKKPQQRRPDATTLEPVTDRWVQAVEASIRRLSSLRQRIQRRQMFGEQRVWRSQLNHLMAQAHLALLHRGLAPPHTPAVHESYSRFHPLAFSLACSGVLVAPDPALIPPSTLGNHRDHLSSSLTRDRDRDEVVSVEEDSKEPEERPPSRALQQPDDPDQPDPSSPSRDPTQTLQDSLHKAALHLRRAMVLAHRGAHWACLQYACQTAWEQSSSLAGLMARDPHNPNDPPPSTSRPPAPPPRTCRCTPPSPPYWC
ncbi:Cilia- and flagella-associated protein 54 [Merluccius polli]|uniref:Cilia- and flagella-associated protein 54 n=1 Tax=Merluccius polli TaxID=89951 RepID=A0AA47MZ11_MERPO|nr:Cilia- and flagella-associated protein 54 [Merluccius polli]